jgi:hypothetical protein
MLRSVENAGPSPAAPARDVSPDVARAGGEGERAAPADEVAPGEAEAWAEVLAGWDDEARHRAYLARFTDLEGLAAAGRRYRDALLARPGDAIAARQRDEVIRRAVAQGLAALPRTVPGADRARAAARLAALAVFGALALAAVVVLRSLGAHLGAAP